MKDEQIAKAMRGFVKAWVEHDVDKAVSFCNEDVTWVTPNGTFRGKAGIRKYIEWSNARVADQKVVETGIKVIAQGNTGIYEHVIGGIVDEKEWETLALCVYEFKDDKIDNMRTVYDRLDIAKQLAKGFFAKSTVNGVVSRMERGLH
jgi:limonene-1,2-epoxide hydrolase